MAYIVSRGSIIICGGIRDLWLRHFVEVLKTKCKCGHLNVIPINGRLAADEPIKCEKCGKAIVTSE